jgi:hypothetical protein
LDAYLGSGTTAAVAMKMGRDFLGIEQGPHIATHCVNRLRAVRDGEPGGISPLVGWMGGGRLRVLLAPVEAHSDLNICGRRRLNCPSLRLRVFA